MTSNVSQTLELNVTELKKNHYSKIVVFKKIPQLNMSIIAFVISTQKQILSLFLLITTRAIRISAVK